MNKKIEYMGARKIIMIAVIISVTIWIFTDIDSRLISFSHGMEQNKDDGLIEFKRVLVLNSYDESYRWTSGQSNAITASLKKKYDDILIFVEYMDTKYHPGPDNLEHLYKLYRFKYSDQKIDLIYTTDNAALQFAIEHRRDLFSDAPIVFSGVMKDSAEAILAGADRVTGVYEALDPVGTLDAAVKINPAIEKVYVIHDNSQSGIDSKNQIMMDHNRYKCKLVFLNMMPIGEITDTLKNLEQDSIVLLGAYNSDVTGYRLPADKFAELISESSAVPVYDMWDFRFGNGVLGGSLLSGATTGNIAAELGIRILEGESVGGIPIVDQNVTEKIYDYTQLERFGIRLDQIPKDSKIINKPFSFYDTYKELVIGIFIAFAVLITYILLLIININNRKKAERKAREANLELTALYEQLYAFDQQQKHQLKELSTAHEMLQLSEEKYRMVAEATNDIIWDWSIHDNVIHHSGGLKEILGYNETEIRCKEDWYNIILPEDLEFALKSIPPDSAEQNSIIGEYRVRHKSGKIIWISSKAKVVYNESGQPEKIVGSHTDVTKLKEYQEKILEMAYYDELTGLPNRFHLKEHITDITRNITDTQVALVYVDIDNFKAINDNFGHGEGDKLLIAVGNILKEITDEGDLVFRHGGDEFVVILNHADRKEEIYEYAARLKGKLDNPIRLTEGEFHISMSGGIVLFPSDGTDYDTLLKYADIAMNYVKNNGKNNLVFFDNTMAEGSKEKLLLDHQLRAAVKEMNFTVHYQPIVDIADGKIKKFEALIRWQAAESGYIPPSVFIKLAEENGLILPIGDWIMKKSCLFAAQLASMGHADISVSINISPIQLKQKDFVEKIKDILSETNVKARRIELEITESILIDSVEASLKKLHELKSLGVSISLDDFGQGYSSLTYLRMLPINTLKIDKAFLDHMSIDRNGQIISTIIELAHRMEVEVVAEGVETQEQLRFLHENECDQAQGYFFSRPVPETEALDLIQQRYSTNEGGY